MPNASKLSDGQRRSQSLELGTDPTADARSLERVVRRRVFTGKLVAKLGHDPT